jgi:hypothetical protein
MLKRLIKILYKKKYKLYEEPYRLNIVGLRGETTVSNRFDDSLYVFYKDETGKWNFGSCPITTDPGTYWLENPSQVDGTAILEQGQYEDAYSLGLHKGQYLALVETKPVRVIRDYDRNAYLDFYNGKEEVGNFGINIHRANATGNTQTVDKWSAGCQVFQRATDFAKFLTLCVKHRNLYGNKFTYTLIDARAFRRQVARWAVYGTGFLLAASCVSLLYKQLKK